MSDSGLQTEFEFTLPQGYVDEEGTVHKEGRMRLATAADEIQPLNDPKVQENSSYMTVVLLSRVVTQLGSIEEVTPEIIESLFVSDLAYLQRLYEQINNGSTEFANATDSVTAEDEEAEADTEPDTDGETETETETEPEATPGNSQTE